MKARLLLMALLIAARHPAKIAGLILASPALRLSRTDRQILGYTIGSVYYVLLPAAFVSEFATKNPLTVPHTAVAVENVTCAAQREIVLETLRGDEQITRVLAGVLGARRMKWGRPVEGSLGPATRSLAAADALVALGAIRTDLERPAEALEAYERALPAFHADDLRASWTAEQAGLLLADEGRHEEALGFFTFAAERAEAESLLTRALGQVFAVAEAYPDLKANAQFVQLQERISSLEGLISDRRELYNESVNLNNVGIESFPQVLIARMFGFQARELLHFDATETADVDVRGAFRS